MDICPDTNNNLPTILVATYEPTGAFASGNLISLIFGKSGMHTRAAVSTNSLPLGVSVEVDAIFELD